jgi:hypothetical protein
MLPIKQQQQYQQLRTQQTDLHREARALPDLDL